MSKYRYREVKNYIHNELKLTKEDIKEIMIPIVKEEVKRIFQNTYGNDVDIERWVRCMVSKEKVSIHTQILKVINRQNALIVFDYGS